LGKEAPIKLATDESEALRPGESMNEAGGGACSFKEIMEKKGTNVDEAARKYAEVGGRDKKKKGCKKRPDQVPLGVQKEKPDTGRVKSTLQALMNLGRATSFTNRGGL